MTADRSLVRHCHRASIYTNLLSPQSSAACDPPTPPFWRGQLLWVQPTIFPTWNAQPGRWDALPCRPCTCSVCAETGVRVAQLHGEGARAALPDLPADLAVIYVLHADKAGNVQTPLPPAGSRCVAMGLRERRAALAEVQSAVT